MLCVFIFIKIEDCEGGAIYVSSSYIWYYSTLILCPQAHLSKSHDISESSGIQKLPLPSSWVMLLSKYRKLETLKILDDTQIPL